MTEFGFCGFVMLQNEGQREYIERFLCVFFSSLNVWI